MEPKHSLLVNGRPRHDSSGKVKEALRDLARFTACMLVIIAVLDAFMHTNGVKYIIKHLNTLFSATSEGELVLSTELDIRINAWRSTACLRDLSYY